MADVAKEEPAARAWMKAEFTAAGWVGAACFVLGPVVAALALPGLAELAVDAARYPSLYAGDLAAQRLLVGAGGVASLIGFVLLVIGRRQVLFLGPPPISAFTAATTAGVPPADDAASRTDRAAAEEGRGR